MTTVTVSPGRLMGQGARASARDEAIPVRQARGFAPLGNSLNEVHDSCNGPSSTNEKNFRFISTRRSELAPLSWSSESLGNILTGKDTDHAKSPQGFYVGM